MFFNIKSVAFSPPITYCLCVVACVLTHSCLVFDFKTNIGIKKKKTLSFFGSNLPLHVFSLRFFFSSLLSSRQLPKECARAQTFCRSLCFTIANLGNGKLKNGRIQKNRSYKIESKMYKQKIGYSVVVVVFSLFFLFLPPFRSVLLLQQFACCFIILFSYCIFGFNDRISNLLFYEVSASHCFMISDQIIIWLFCSVL